MHVLIIPSWYTSRHRPISGIFFKEQAEILTKIVDKVGVVSPIFKSFRNFNDFNHVGCKHTVNNVLTYTKELWYLPSMPFFNAQNWYNLGKQLFEEYILDNGLPDIIHIHSIIYSGKLAKYIKQRYNIPFIVTEHSTGFELNMYSTRTLEKFSDELSYSSANIAVSRGLAETLYKRVGHAWEIVPNTIQNIFFEEGLSNVNKEKNKEKKIFFTLSYLIPIKGIDILVRAFSDLIKEKKDVELWIGGDGSDRKKIENLIKILKIEDKVFLLGSLDRKMVIENFKKAHFYVSPSLQETFGIVIIEALAMGLPTIATACGGPEYIINDDVGIIIKRNSAEDLLKAMRTMIDSESDFDRKKIIEYCQMHYSEKVVSNNILNVYKRILNG